MAKDVTLTIDGTPVTVPDGTLIVNAAKKIGIDIPVFCYHPKMEPVGMCRMCLVEVGRPVIDRATGQPVLEADGLPRVQFGPKLETACTTSVSEGMVVLNSSEKARAGRKDILEFLLTSHPLDCPVCDKGGECPLQNLTMGFGPGESRFIYDEKKHLAKHVPLGDLILLDRERCIQCGRCVRFQDRLVGEPVIGFSQRGRSLEIVTFSEPGFDSVFSGNTTDICPVGALTTTDFHFQARPWELKAAASICNHCPVGCNLTFNVRREAASGGNVAIKRAMPRQNEQVNEIWICDKGRFGYHFTDPANRLQQPLVRKNGELVAASWDEALDLVAERFRQTGTETLTLASGRLANEDLFNLASLAKGLGGKTVLDSSMAGGDLTAQIGFAPGTNFSSMDAQTAILVVACDLEEEAPVWWLRVKQAAERGANLIVANPRLTSLDRYARQSLRYAYGSEAAVVLALLNSLSAKRPDLPRSVQTLLRSEALRAAASSFAEAANAVVIFGSEGTGYAASKALAQACTNLLIATNHVGRPNNGLLGVWQRANDQGAWDMGFRPVDDVPAALGSARALYLVGTDPISDEPSLLTADKRHPADKVRPFVVVQDLFMTPTARLADVVLPVQAYTEREGSYTSGERRVQRFYPALPQPSGSADSAFPTDKQHPADIVRPKDRPAADFAITGRIAQRLGMDLEFLAASRVMARIAESVAGYDGLSYQKLAEVHEQWPIIGRADLYYGGTSYENRQGLGVQLTPAVQRGISPALGWINPGEIEEPQEGLLAVPVTRLYDRGSLLLYSKVLQPLLPSPYIELNPVDAGKMQIQHGQTLQVVLGEGGYSASVTSVMTARLVENVPPGVALVPRSLGLMLKQPSPIQLWEVADTDRPVDKDRPEVIA